MASRVPGARSSSAARSKGHKRNSCHAKRRRGIIRPSERQAMRLLLIAGPAVLSLFVCTNALGKTVQLDCDEFSSKGRPSSGFLITYQEGAQTAFVERKENGYTFTTNLQLTPSKAKMWYRDLKSNIDLVSIWEVDRTTGAIEYSIPIINAKEYGTCKVVEAPANRIF